MNPTKTKRPLRWVESFFRAPRAVKGEDGKVRRYLAMNRRRAWQSEASLSREPGLQAGE